MMITMIMLTVMTIMIQVKEVVNDVFRFVGLREHDIEDVEAKNTRSYEQMQPQVYDESAVCLC